MNTDNYNRIKLKYKIYFVFIVWGGIALSYYPSLYYVSWLESTFEVSERGGLYDFLYLLVVFINVILGCVIISFLISIYKNWSLSQALDYFVRYENLPKHWLKDE